MIESIQRIHSRIGEIQNRFNKLGFNTPTINNKSFAEHLNEAMSDIDTTNNSENKKVEATNNKALDMDAFKGKISLGVYEDSTSNNTNFDKAINAYQKREVKHPDTYNNIIKEASEKFSVPEDLIKAVIKQESNYMPTVISNKGAIGLMQIMPATGEELGINDKEQLKDPYTNIMAGTKYLSQMLNRYDGRLDLSLSAYNAGPTLVDRLQRIPNIEETQNYVRNIIKNIK